MSLASGDVFARDSLSNLAASLNAGRDKAAGDAFFVFDLGRGQVEAMYRGDWLARKVVDIVPYDMVREWRAWSGDRAAVAAAEAAEKRFGLRKSVQRALTLGRLYGGGALIIGTGESDPAALASELVPDRIRPGDIKFLHVVSRWQLSAPTVNRDPLSRWFGEPDLYEITAPTRGALQLHPSRVIRFLGNELPDPWLGVSAWSDSVLQTLYDAVHAVALTTTGATSLMHEAKVDVVTVPNLSEHLSSAATTEQLSARFSYAAAMKSLNNLLLLGDGETWSRQKIDFAGLPEMVRTFLQVAAGAADIPVTRLLGQSPAGMSATGESDTRNYYDMIASRQAIDLRPKLERLDQLLLRSAGVDPDALSFEFRPLWQMDAAASAAIALQKAQATQIYAGLGLWPAATTAALVQSQLIEDGTYPGADSIFADAKAPASQPTIDFDPDQPRDPDGRWTNGGWSGGLPSIGGTPPTRIQTAAPPKPHHSKPPPTAHGLSGLLELVNPIGAASAQEIEPDEENRGLESESGDPTEQLRIERYVKALNTLREIDSNNAALARLSAPGYVPTERDIARLEAAARTALAAKADLGPPSETLPASPDANGRREPSPPGLVISVRGATTKQVGDSYSEQVREFYGAVAAEKSNQPKASVPDGLMINQDDGNIIAIEAKYVGRWGPGSPYYVALPGYSGELPYKSEAVEKIVDQALKYDKAYRAGVLWVTNSDEFVDAYTEKFVAAGVKNFRFVVIPAVREGRDGTDLDW